MKERIKRGYNTCHPINGKLIFILHKLCVGHKSTIQIFCCNAALRTTRGRMYVCMYVCMSPLAFLSFTQKIFKQPIPQNL